jgi:hypothetical protein
VRGENVPPLCRQTLVSWDNVPRWWRCCAWRKCILVQAVVVSQSFFRFLWGTRVIIVTRVALWCRGKVLDSLTGSSVAMNLQGFPQNVHGFWRYVDEGGRNHEPCVDLFRERVDMGKHKLCSRIIPSRGVFVRWRDLPMGLANANILPSVECEPSSFAFPWRMLPSLCLQLGQVRFR